MDYVQEFLVDFESSDAVQLAAKLNDNVLALANAKYGKRCFKGYYLIEALEIKQISRVYVIKAGARVDALIKFSVKQYAVGDVFPKVTIENKQTVMTFNYNNYINGSLQNTVSVRDKETKISFLNPSVMITSVEHLPMEPNVTVVTKLLIPDFDEHVFHVDSELTAADMPKIDFLIGLIREEHRRRSELNADDRKVLDRLELVFYPRAIKPTERSPDYPGFESIKQPSCINLLEHLAAKKSTVGTWSRSISLFRSSPLVEKLPLEKDHIITPPAVAILSLLHNMYSWLKIIRQHQEVYDVKTIDLPNTYMSFVIRTKVQ